MVSYSLLLGSFYQSHFQKVNYIFFYAFHREGAVAFYLSPLVTNIFWRMPSPTLSNIFYPSIAICFFSSTAGFASFFATVTVSIPCSKVSLDIIFGCILANIISFSGRSLHNALFLSTCRSSYLFSSSSRPFSALTTR